jgi:MFS family permease
MGTSNVLWLDAASFGISALLIGVMVPTDTTAKNREAPWSSLRDYLADVAAGVSLIRHDRLILLLELSSTMGNALGAALFAVALPVYALRAFGDPTSLGLMLGGFGGGALASALLFGIVGYRLPRRALFTGALVVSIFPDWVIAATPALWVAVGALVVDGLATGPYGPIVMTIFQERVPADYRGRVFGMALALDNATTPLAILLTGYLLDAFGLTPILVALATINLVVTVAVVLHPALRGMDPDRTSPPSPLS